MPDSELSIRIQPRDLEILRSLFESRIMHPRHIAALHFDGNGETAKRRLTKLKSAKLIGERPRHVNEPSVLFLTRKAFAILKSNGILQEYPPLGPSSFEKRSQVATATIRHELEVLDVKAAVVSAIRKRPNFTVHEFTTWPALNAFTANVPGEAYARSIRPDGFIHIFEQDDKGKCDYTLFLELDQSTEGQEVLALKAACYADYYRSGGFALQKGGERSDFKQFPFRVLFVLKNPERRNNTAETLLRINPPVFRQVYLSTISEVKADPLGAIWIRPIDYRDSLTGTAYDTDRQRTVWGYKRQTEREMVVEKSIKKVSLLE